ncbi:MAG: hypothetical protein FJY85_00105 [Deltaproteobacteria bacterium]|nr:hypothetical protein [Deltaproteobacteria bacterium]
MNKPDPQQSTFGKIKEYALNLQDLSPFWRVQAAVWGVIITVVVVGGVLFVIVGLSGVFGGGDVAYEAQGSPGPVVFRHYTHMWFKDGKYKECKTCHDKLFAAQKYGTYVIRALKDSPPKKVRIGRDASTLYVPGTEREDEVALVTYQVSRARSTCATGECHDGKESFGRFECLSCHQTK